MTLAKNSLYFQFIMLELLFDFSRGEVLLMTRLKDFIENCRWALPTACSLSCKAALPYPCVLLQGLLSASHPETKPFSFYYYWRLWLFFNFLSFVAGMSSICFSVIDSCSHFSPPAFGRALCSAELCQCLQSLELCLCSSCLCPAASACPQHPGHCPRCLFSLGPACAGNHPSFAGIPSFPFVPPCLAPVLWANSTWSRLECLQGWVSQFPVSLPDQVNPGSLRSSASRTALIRSHPGAQQAPKEVLAGSCKLGYLPRSWAYLCFRVASAAALLILINSSCASRSYCWRGSLKEQNCLAQGITDHWHQSHTLTGQCSILLRHCSLLLILNLFSLSHVISSPWQLSSWKRRENLLNICRKISCFCPTAKSH